LAVKAPLYKAPPPVAMFSWTGCYLGASGGYAWGRSSTTTTIIDPGLNFADPVALARSNANMSPTVNPKGGVVGGQIGCNYQSGNFVFGAETDLSYFRLTDSVLTTVVPTGVVRLNSVTAVSTNWLWTARLRAGFTADRALFYVTGGVAAAKVNYEQFNSFVPCGGPGGICLELGAASATRAGWTAGVGLEYAVTNNWTLKAEYLYMDFGSLSTSGTINAFAPANVPFNHSANLKVSTVRVGINYLFGGPVVAKY
jgi:outer membrane immunogenic protein